MVRLREKPEKEPSSAGSTPTDEARGEGREGAEADGKSALGDGRSGGRVVHFIIQRSAKVFTWFGEICSC